MAGNTMDRMLAKKMYESYMEELRLYDEITYRQAQRERDLDMLLFERMAEEVKVGLNDRVPRMMRGGATVSANLSEPYGGPLSGGRQVESEMTVGEMEECLRPCLGEKYCYEDYKRFERLGVPHPPRCRWRRFPGCGCCRRSVSSRWDR